MAEKTNKDVDSPDKNRQGVPTGTRHYEGEQGMDQLRADIHKTESEISDTLSALQSRLDVGHLKNEAKERVRGATAGRTKDMMRNVSDRAVDIGKSIVASLKENPVPSALIALGLGWIVAKNWRNGSESMEEFESEDYGGEAAETGSELKARAREKLETWRSKAEDMSQRAKDYSSGLQEKSKEWSEMAQEKAVRAKESSAEMLEENIFGAAVAAFLAGALISALIPEAGSEKQFLSGAGEAISEKAQQMEQKAADTVKYAADSAKEAAEKKMDEEGMRH